MRETLRHHLCCPDCGSALDLAPDDVRNRTLLDGGCGKGRHLRVMAGFGAREVIGVDVSLAVDVAYANTRALPNVHVVQADLQRLPLRNHFDLAYSIGVIHHTSHPQRCFEAIAGHVRPGGTVTCWVYGRENNGWIVWLVNPIRIGLTRYLPAGVLRVVAWVLAVVLNVVIAAVYRPAEAMGVRLFYRDYLLNLGQLGFAEIHRVVKPGGCFFWREPLNDFFLWRWLRAVLYRLSPMLDADTERPLRTAQTRHQLAGAGLDLVHWKPCGLIGFCLFMNSDVLVVNRLLRHVPGIRRITRAAVALDERLLRLPWLRHAGLQVVGAARKPPGVSSGPGAAPITSGGIS